MKRKIVVVRQPGVKDCGVASMLSIIRYYRGNINIEKLRNMTNTDRLGTSAYNIIDCASKLGFNSKGIKCNKIYDLEKIRLPCIAHVIINKSYKHYVVIYNVNYQKRVVTIMDPSIGIRKMPFKNFEEIWTKVIITFIPIKKIPYYKDDKKIMSIILNILKYNKKVFISILILSIFITLFSIINSYYLKLIIDNLISSINNLYLISIVFFVVIVLKNICNYFRNKLSLLTNQKIEFQITTQSIKHIINLPYDYFKNKTTGDILARISDLNYIKEMINKLLSTLFVDSILFITSAIILLSINLTLFLTTLIIFIMYSFIVIISSLYSKDKIPIVQEKYSYYNSKLVESINGYESVKSLNLQNITVNDLENKYIDYLNQNYKVSNIYNIQGLLKNLISEGGILLILVIGFISVMNGNISLGSLITYNSILVYFLDPIKNILELEPLIRYASSSFKRMNEILQIDDEKLIIDYKYTGNKIMGDIIFNNYTYEINDTVILKDINLNIKIGEKVLLTGESGSGKSTLLKSILRYYEIDRNKIYIKDKDINDYNLKELRNNIIYISQNEKLFTSSIIDNIKVQRNIDYDNFLKLAKLTEVDEICKDKVLGYDTLIEEDGFNISGGEKSRIILCRALVKDANIYLIDEVLNELDAKMERRILTRLFDYLKDKTIIIISHRLDNIDLYDKVIKIVDKTVLERDI